MAEATMAVGGLSEAGAGAAWVEAGMAAEDMAWGMMVVREVATVAMRAAVVREVMREVAAAAAV